jgi:hypothetical protein
MVAVPIDRRCYMLCGLPIPLLRLTLGRGYDNIGGSIDVNSPITELRRRGNEVR